MDLTAKEFEILLCEFCKQDLPKNFKIEHDVKDVGGESKINRQIDTKITGKIGILDILICGEAKNWNDKVGSEIIDGMVGKYMTGEIRANKVILFSNKGYTEPAITRAIKLGIELIEPEEINYPIKKIPHIVGVGYLGRMKIRMIGNTQQYSEITTDPEEFIIIKGSEKISFNQNICRLLVYELRRINEKSIFTDLSNFKIIDENVLYELKFKEGFRYYINFEVDVTIDWDYFVEDLPTGILRHLNSDEVRLVNMNGNDLDILQKILHSPTKVNYESKEKCIDEIVNKNERHLLQLCIVDPDRHKTNPENLILIDV